MAPIDREGMEEVLRTARRIAVLGIKPETHAGQPAADIPAYLAEVGYQVIPVPVRYPEVDTILGLPVERDLRALRPPPDIVDVFRRPEDVPGHLEDLLALRPGLVWFQSGCFEPGTARRLEAAGIPTCHDCIYVVHRRMVRR